MGRERKLDIYKVAIVIMSFRIVIVSATRLVDVPNIIDNLMIVSSLLFSLMDFIHYRKYSLSKILIIFFLGILCCFTSFKTMDYNLLFDYFMLRKS